MPVTTNTTPMSMEAMQAKIAELQSQLESNKNKQTVSFKVSEKGAVSAYGLGRFPVTLYGSQWGALIAAVPKLEQFLSENRDKLAVKGAVKA